MTYYAHSFDSDCRDNWQTLDEHLAKVSQRAASFLSPLKAESWGRAAGLMHDVGKACPEFQRRLQGSTERVDHSTVGSDQALVCYPGCLGELLALVIAGHHGGMPNWTLAANGRNPLKKRLQDLSDPPQSVVEFRKALVQSLPRDSDLKSSYLQVVGSFTPPNILKEALPFRTFAFEHLVFSSLVDADYLDTESFVDEDSSMLRSVECSTMEDLLNTYNEYMNGVESDASCTEVNQYRRDVRSACLDSGKQPVGIFSLSVVTGGGKTLSSMGFALTHAIANGLKRVIVAIPYTSIVEQTADVLRTIFGEQNVLEHHSNYDYDSLPNKRAEIERLTAQNWDAPIVVTTNVQLFESLFSNRPGRSRKVHNIAKSVIVLDEVQTLPDPILLPTLAMIETLPAVFGSSVVACTATQPHLEKVWPFHSSISDITDEKVAVPEELRSRTALVNRGLIQIGDFCDEFERHDQALCIVGKKKEAIEVYEKLLELRGGNKEGIYCLTTYMTPYHRSIIIGDIKRRLSEGLPCLVASTQLIEAGVDLDFPVVYRELAGIDSLYQAAGRCNREGCRGPNCPVYVFELVDEFGDRITTTKWLESLKSISRELFSDDGALADDAVEQFFRIRYGGKGARNELLDSHGLLCCINKSINIRESEYATVAENYRFIDTNTAPVFVRWGDEAEDLYQKIIASHNPCALVRSAQRHSIALRDDEIALLRSKGCVRDEYEPFIILDASDGCRVFYDNDVGFRADGKEDLLTLTI